MVLCLECRQYYFRPTDRFCGHCGKPLAKLECVDGGHIEVPANAKGIVERKIEVRNSGLADLELTLREPSDVEIFTIDSERHLLLRPFDEPKRITLRINCDRLTNLEEKIVRVPFESTDPNRRHGELSVTYPEPGEILIPDTDINLGSLRRAVAGKRGREEREFSLLVKNTGGKSVVITLSPQPEDEKFRVRLVRGETVTVFGYEERKIDFIAWSEELEENKVQVSFELVFGGVAEDAAKNCIIRLEATLYTAPTPECHDINFGELLPRQIILETIIIRNSGSLPFKIIGIHADSKCVRPLLMGRTIPVEPGGVGTAIEFLFSTRFGEEELPAGETKPKGKITFVTDIPGFREFTALWEAKIQLPREAKGIFAIDFGTVNSCVAYIEPGKKPEVIKDRVSNKSLIPSVLVFREPDVFVTGTHAERGKDGVAPDCVVHSVKRSLLGSPKKIFGKTYEPVELVSLQIEQLLLEVAHRRNTRPEKIALSVPANFWGPLRGALIDACKLSWNLRDENQLEVLVIDEPTAVATYYVYMNLKQFRRYKKAKRLLVFDFGGGTLDISIVEVKPVKGRGTQIGPIIARGDNQMGGIDLDVALLKDIAVDAKSRFERFDRDAISMAKEEFQTKYMNHKKKGEFQEARSEWYNRSRTAKETLSSKENVKFSPEQHFLDKDGSRLVDTTGAVIDFEKKIRRSDFNSSIRENVKKAKEIVRATLDQCSFTPEDIDFVLLTGLTCRIPYVRREISSIFNKTKAVIPSEDEFPLKTSVACGAAYAAYIITQPGKSQLDIRNLEKTSYRYGYIQLADGGMSKEFVELIDINTSFEDSKRFKEIQLADSDGWKSIEIAQNASKRRKFDPFDMPPEVTILGTVDIPSRKLKESKNQIKLGMSFSQTEGKLVVEINDEAASLRPQSGVEDTYV